MNDDSRSTVPRGPSGTRSVTFDTNAYRGLSDVAMDALTEAGRARGDVAYVSFYTTVELLSHAASSEDPAYRKARAAIRRIWRHTGDAACGTAFVPMIQENRVQLCHLLFDEVPQTANATIVQQLYELLRHVANAAPDDLLLDVKPRLEAVLGLRRGLEEIFIDDLVSPLVQSGLIKNGKVVLDSSQRDAVRTLIASGRGRELRALRLARDAAHALGRECHEDVFKDAKGRSVLEILATPLVLFEELVCRICFDGFAPGTAECANWIWDIEQSFQASRHLLAGGRPTLLVTNDRAILRAAKTALNAGHASSISQYADELGVRV